MVLIDPEKENRHIVNDNHEIVDKIQEQIGGTATIFQLRDLKTERRYDLSTIDRPYNQAMVRVSANVKNSTAHGPSAL